MQRVLDCHGPPAMPWVFNKAGSAEQSHGSNLGGFRGRQMEVAFRCPAILEMLCAECHREVWPLDHRIRNGLLLHFLALS